MKTSFQVQSLTGRPEFTNRLHHFRLTGELRMTRVFGYGSLQFGRGREIESGDDPTSPKFNPLTGETSRLTDLTFGVQAFESRYTGKVDVGVGDFGIFTDPLITTPSTYRGVFLSARGHRKVENGLGIDYRFAYIPQYSVGGSAKPYVEDRDISHVRVALEYAVGKAFGLTGGWQEYRTLAGVPDQGQDHVRRFQDADPPDRLLRRGVLPILSRTTREGCELRRRRRKFDKASRAFCLVAGLLGGGKLIAPQSVNGAPCKTRTCDLLVRSQTLYPTELRARRV